MANDAKNNKLYSLHKYYVDNKEYINNMCISDILCELTDDCQLLTYFLNKLPNLSTGKPTYSITIPTTNGRV